MLVVVIEVVNVVVSTFDWPRTKVSGMRAMLAIITSSVHRDIVTFSGEGLAMVQMSRTQTGVLCVSHVY